MKRATTVLAVLVLFLSAAPTAAAGGKPTRTFSEAPAHVVFSGQCSFDVAVDVLTNREYVLQFPDGHLLVTGAFVLRLTNASNASRTLTVNVSGPSKIVFNDDGSVRIAFAGRNTWFLSSTDAGGPGIFLTSGGGTVVFGPSGTITSRAVQGHETALCPVLA